MPNREHAHVDTRSIDESAAIIVTFNPDLAILSREVTALEPQVARIVIVDNGSTPDTLAALQSLVIVHPSITLIPLTSNLGIAYAQNAGVTLLRSTSPTTRYVLLLDHDSIPSEDLVASLFDAAESLRAAGLRVSGVGARLIDPRSGKENGFYRRGRLLWGRVRCDHADAPPVACDLLNSSGSYHPVDALSEVGLFDESMFIDLIDTDWYFRAQRIGYRAYGVCRGQLNHFMGESIIRYWLFGWRVMPRRSAARHYYIFRNSIWLQRRRYIPWSWRLSNALVLAFTLAYYAVFDRDRSAQARSMLRGLRDGLRVPAPAPSRA